MQDREGEITEASLLSNSSPAQKENRCSLELLIAANLQLEIIKLTKFRLQQ